MRAANQPVEQVNQEVASTSFGDVLVATAWRGGQQLADALPVSSFQLDWDASRWVQGQAALVVADPHGDLWPRKIDDPLAPGGSRLHLAYRFGATGTTIPLGWWRIRKTHPQIFWTWRVVGADTLDAGGTLVWIPHGGTITIEADEELASLALDRLDIGERHPITTHVHSEVAYLVNRYLQTNPMGIPDASLRSDIAYEEDRLPVIQSLLDRVDATYRMGGDGRLELIPAVGVPVDWRIDPGAGGTLVQVDADMSDESLANGVTSWVQLEDETTLTGRWRLVGGPLAWDGPFGRVLAFRGANLATTQAEVDLDATTTGVRLSTQGDVELSLATLAHPGLQIGDRVPLGMPRFPYPRRIDGRVTGMTLNGRDGVADKQMGLRLAVSHADLTALAG